jgi:hypothetical protein
MISFFLIISKADPVVDKVPLADEACALIAIGGGRNSFGDTLIFFITQRFLTP